MAIFAISDLHLSLGGDKPMSVFGDKWDGYTEKMMQSWNSIVTEEDLVVIPGDISWSTYIDDAVMDFSYIHSLNGHKLIFKGNHDYWWTTPKKMNEFLSKNNFDSIEIIQNKAHMYNDIAICGTRGWNYPSSSSSEDSKIFEREKQRLILSLEDAISKRPKKIIVVMHYPPIDNMTGASDFLDIMKQYNVDTCLFGHLHAASCVQAPIGEYSGIKLRLVACDYLNFAPLLIKV